MPSKFPVILAAAFLMVAALIDAFNLIAMGSDTVFFMRTLGSFVLTVAAAIALGCSVMLARGKGLQLTAQQDPGRKGKPAYR